MMLARNISLPACLVVLPAVIGSASADVLLLKDGKKLEGEVAAKGNVYDVQTKYGVLNVAKGEVDKVVPAVETLTREAEDLRSKAKTIFEEADKLEVGDPQRTGKLNSALETLQRALDGYNEARAVYSWDAYAHLDDAITAILRDMGLYRSRLAAPEPALAKAAPEKTEKKAGGPTPTAEKKPTASAPKPATPPASPPPAKPAAAAKPPAPSGMKGLSPALKAKAEAGNVEAQFDVGLFCERKVYLAEALWWYRQAAEQGHLRAQIRLGCMARYGKSGKTDYAEAQKWFRKAADQGSATAEFNLGALLYEGKGVKADRSGAEAWFRKAAAHILPEAAKGDPDAQYALGYMMGMGWGMKENNRESVQWYTRAAVQGHAMAINNIAVRYTRGDGVSKNNAEAIRYYVLAARQGEPQAQANLAYMFEKGDGVAKNLEEARMWYFMAAQQGDKGAIPGPSAHPGSLVEPKAIRDTQGRSWTRTDMKSSVISLPSPEACRIA